MEVSGQDPDQLLKSVQNKDFDRHRGHLKIFFGYAAGVGKTYAMLKAVHDARHRGVDVVIGYVESYAKPQTTALLSGLEVIPACEMKQGGIAVSEFDLDAALERRPGLIVVDELAHTNAEGCRHNKRYQDVKELLQSGIDVYTTVNVQNIESLNDTVAAITGTMIRERIPDSVFDNAHQVELVDIEPADLLSRLKEGNIYRETQTEYAANFFTVANLTALREVALRRCADRMNILTENARIKSQRDYHTDEHILVCLSCAPSNAKIVRTAARMANAFRGTFTALFVETPDFAVMGETDKKCLRTNMRLAEQLGAAIETVYGEDVSYQIAEFARLSGVSKIVIGRSNITRKYFWSKPALTEKLTAIAPNSDIYIIPDHAAENNYCRSKERTHTAWIPTWYDIGESILILLLATLLGFIFSKLGFTEANIITVYILGVLITSVVTTSRICCLISSIISVLVFNFFFTVPQFTFIAYDKGYPVTFAIMFIAALLTGSLAAKLKSHIKQSAQAVFRTKVLLDTNQLLQKAESNDEIIHATGNQMMKLLSRTVVIYPVKEGRLESPHIICPEDTEQGKGIAADDERAVAEWVLKNNKRAGAATDTLSGAKCLYLAIRVGETVYGVVGITIDGRPLDSFENSVMLSILGECALAMENKKNAGEKERAAVLAQNEQLRANLLRSISHDLRTPLTSISGNASNLISNSDSFDEAAKKRIYTDIYEDSMWLINLVENLLAVTRIEGGKMNLKLSAELMDEVVTEALRHINRKSVEHTITVESKEDFILAKIDARLIVQVVINIVDNAIKYTPDGSHILITTEKRRSTVVMHIADNGPGISDDAKPRIFDMFYSGINRIADSRRSLGLGLSLCKSIVNAHGGEISVQDNVPHGTIFTFTLPSGEVEIHE